MDALPAWIEDAERQPVSPVQLAVEPGPAVVGARRVLVGWPVAVELGAPAAHVVAAEQTAAEAPGSAAPSPVGSAFPVVVGAVAAVEVEAAAGSVESQVVADSSVADSAALASFGSGRSLSVQWLV